MEKGGAEKVYKGVQYIDYSSVVPGLDYRYDPDFYPNDEDLPDIQASPVLVGAPVPIQKVGVAPLDLPITLLRRDGTVSHLHAKASLYGSLDDPKVKGLNFSRFYELMHDKIADHLSIPGMMDVLKGLQEKQNCQNAFCKLRFAYPWTQKTLATRKKLPVDAPDGDVFRIDGEGNKLSHERIESHIFYDVELEGQLIKDQYKFFVTVAYYYGSLCPCSMCISQRNVQNGLAATGHSQKSVAKVTVEFNPDNIVWIEDIVELCRRKLPTETQVRLKRRDEGQLGRLFNANAYFVEDAARLLYSALDDWFDQGKIRDFRAVVEHCESIHRNSVFAVVYKGLGLS